jgi:hypothetical protein
MNMNQPNDEDRREASDLELRLQSVAPAPAASDATELMYRCGYAAGRRAVAAEVTSVRTPYQAGAWSLVCAALLGAVLVGPIAYQWGSRAESANRQLAFDAGATDVESGRPVNRKESVPQVADPEPRLAEGSEQSRLGWERFIIFEAWFNDSLSEPLAPAGNLVSKASRSLEPEDWLDSDWLLETGRFAAWRGAGRSADTEPWARLTARPDLSQIEDWLP